MSSPDDNDGTRDFPDLWSDEDLDTDWDGMSDDDIAARADMFTSNIPEVCALFRWPAVGQA